jgi:hypothetical protein
MERRSRKANGLEAAIVDHRVMLLHSLAPDDVRSFEVAVAGPAALLVAKLHKIAERETTPERWAPKDSLDVLRILRGVDLAQMATTLPELEGDSVAGTVTREARTYLEVLFADRNAHGARMAVRASAGLEDASVIALSCEALARRLLATWGGPP